MDNFFMVQDRKRPITNTDLYYRQIEMLKAMLEKNAINKEQYYYSASYMAEKMGFPLETYLLHNKHK